MPMTSPKSLSIFDELQRKKTLLQGNYAFSLLNFTNLNQLYTTKQETILPQKENICFLGLGANLDDLKNLTHSAKKIYYLECENFSEQISFELPQNFIKLSKENISDFLQTPHCFAKTDFIFYKQNLQLFPKFWRPILIHIFSQYNCKTLPFTKTKTVLLSGSEQDLLHKEISFALNQLNYQAISLTNQTIKEIIPLIDTINPCFFLSINAQNLDINGLIYEYLQKKSIPLALWFVDNPWNILSNINQDWWKNCPIFLTDFSFAEELKKEGAKNIYHLPLASHDIPTKYSDIPQLPLFFVGNSAFKNQQAYYSACNIDKQTEQNLYREIKKNLFESNELPDFHTIYKRLFSNENLWLSKINRTVGYATIKADLYLRKLWIESLHPFLEIMGDNAWDDILTTNPKRYEPVNYFTSLPSYYKNAAFTINLTSLLMPHNLSQRHFDVWKHQGFLLSTPSNGMEIFPQDLTSQYTISCPQHCTKIVEYFLVHTNEKQELKNTMQELIYQKHRYIHRLQELFNICF